MPVSDQDLRDLVHDAVAQHLRNPAAADARMGGAFGHRHESHVLLPMPPGSESDGACLIEPTVRCSHCGYCQSYGH